MRTIFVSYKYEDAKYLNTILNWEKKGLFSDQIKFVYEKQDKRQEGKIGIEKYLSAYLQGMSLLLVLIGQDTHNSEWVNFEIKYAKQRNKVILPVRIPETTGGIPKIIENINPIVYTPTKINAEIKLIYRDSKRELT
jgi:hypothetical protein